MLCVLISKKCCGYGFIIKTTKIIDFSRIYNERTNQEQQYMYLIAKTVVSVNYYTKLYN